MWKKFCVAILSTALLGGAALLSGSLLASGDSELIINQEATHPYIGKEVEMTLSGSQGEQVIYVEGGEFHGNGMTYPIPFQEGAKLSLSQLDEPGNYQGYIQAQIEESQNERGSPYSGTFSFYLYGYAFQDKSNQLQTGETKQLMTYGALPDDLKQPIITYSSSDEAIATVDQDGKVMARQAGEAIIRLVVFDEVQEEAYRLFESSTSVQVKDVTEVGLNPQKAESGESYGYRFQQIDQVYKDIDQEQKVGRIEHPESGSFQYQILEDAKERYTIRDGFLYATKALKENETIDVFVLRSGTDVWMKVPCEIIVSDVVQEPSEDQFAFRYEGQSTTSIVRTYQEGKNSFQLSTNKNIDDVTFQLKNQEDETYLTVSKTGHITIKQVSDKPVIVQAIYHKQSYEVSIVIEKAEQLLRASTTDITISVEDGAFEPLLEGRKGSGHLIGTYAGDEDIVAIEPQEDGSIRFLPKQAGDTTIEIYNEGDSVYKKSNRISFHIHVKEMTQILEPFVGTSDWLRIQGTQGNDAWYTSPVAVQIQQGAPVTQFQYQSEWQTSLALSQDGTWILPLKFQNSQGEESSPAKVEINIDTHTPMITSIQERDAADKEWKEWIDTLTFQSVYGPGKIITIMASDELLKEEMKVSGVAEINYRIYREDEKEEVLVSEGKVLDTTHAEISVADSATHKVCTTVKDHAGLISEEVCAIPETSSEIALTAENAGMVLMSSAFHGTDRLNIQEVPQEMIEQEKEAMQIDSASTMIGYHFVINDNDDAGIEEEIKALVPLPQASMTSKGYWIQKQADDTWLKLPMEQQNQTQVLTLSSMRDIYYVEEEPMLDNELVPLRMSQKSDTENMSSASSTVVTPIAFQPLQLTEQDGTLLIILGGGIAVLCLVILLLRNGSEETE